MAELWRLILINIMIFKNSKTPCWIAVVLLFLIFLFVAVGYIKTWNLPPPKLGEIFFLNDEEIAVLKKRAKEEGDWVSAMLLLWHYGIYLQQPDEAKEWNEIVEKNKGKNWN